MNISALIPARMSSKRLPGKNIKILGGKPLLFWTIDVALEADVFKQICISTESVEVATLVKDSYPHSTVRVIHRPLELATDQASLNDVCTHFLTQYPEIDFLSLLMPTYPFRNAKRITDEIIPPLYSRQVDRVTSVRLGNYSTFDYWVKRGRRYNLMFTLNPLWCGAGNAAYPIQKREYFFLPPHKWPYHLGERTLRIQTNYMESIDIDTPEDFSKAEKICTGYMPSLKKLSISIDSPVEVVGPYGVDSKSLLNFLSNYGVRLDLPVLILRRASPLFTFLRWYECNSSRHYTTDETDHLIANLPTSGHSQDCPVHFIHSPYYRVLREDQDAQGVLAESVPYSQVILEEELKQKWPGYVEPIVWKPPAIPASQ